MAAGCSLALPAAFDFATLVRYFLGKAAKIILFLCFAAFTRCFTVWRLQAGFQNKLSRDVVVPIYAYKCSACNHAQDVLQKMSDPLLTDCPECGKSTYVKQVTAAGFQLKGTGWYVTDFRDGGSAAGKNASGEPAAAAAPATTETSSTPAATPAPATPASGSGA